MWYKLLLFCLNRLKKKEVYWAFDIDENKTVSICLKNKKVYILEEEYFLLKNTLNGSMVLEDFKKCNVPVEIIKQ